MSPIDSYVLLSHLSYLPSSFPSTSSPNSSLLSIHYDYYTLAYLLSSMLINRHCRGTRLASDWVLHRQLCGLHCHVLLVCGKVCIALDRSVLLMSRSHTCFPSLTGFWPSLKSTTPEYSFASSLGCKFRCSEPKRSQVGGCMCGRL
jgi:hypothetical protein